MNKIIKFNKDIENFIYSIGGVNNNDNHYKYKIVTKCCILWINTHTVPSKTYSIFCKFKDYNKAKITNCNPNTGKWNFHSTIAENCLNNFKDSIKRIIK